MVEFPVIFFFVLYAFIEFPKFAEMNRYYFLQSENSYLKIFTWTNFHGKTKSN